ncbi:MAG: TatD family hydrolase [Phocaeicola sp.]
MWFDLHTHSQAVNEGVVAICNHSFSDACSALANENLSMASFSGMSPNHSSFNSSGRACLPLENNSFLPCSASLHPWDITPQNLSTQLGWLRTVIQHDSVVAIGEVGLDKLRGADFSLQLDLFREIVEIAESAQLPLIIHHVKAMNELIVLHKVLHPTTPWILHGFRGKKALALSALQQGFYLSFGQYYHPEALQVTPSDRLFLETDNAPIAIEALYRQAAALRNCSVESLKVSIHNLAYSLFKRMKRA